MIYDILRLQNFELRRCTRLLHLLFPFARAVEYMPLLDCVHLPAEGPGFSYPCLSTERFSQHTNMFLQLHGITLNLPSTSIIVHCRITKSPLGTYALLFYCPGCCPL